MNKEDLKAFMAGKITPKAAESFKVMKIADVASDIKGNLKTEKDLNESLARLEETIGDGDVHVGGESTVNKPSNVSLDAISALMGGKANLAKEIENNNKPSVSEGIKMVKKNISDKVEEKFVSKKQTLNENLGSSMSTSQIKEFIKETVYDFILEEALSENRIKKIVDKEIKQNLKTYLKEALIEIKNKK